MCPHSMAACRISVFSQYRFVTDTIYRSRTGVVTPRSCLIEWSFVIIILVTKHPTWPRLWSPPQAVTAQNLASGGQMPGHGGTPTALGGILRSKHCLNCPVWWKGQSWMAGCWQDLFLFFSSWNLMKENSDIPVLAAGLNLYKCTLLFFFSHSKCGISSNDKIWKQISFNKISLHNNF